MEDLFNPYRILSQDDSQLDLALKSSAKKFNTFFLRVMPFLLVGVTFVYYSLLSADFPLVKLWSAIIIFWIIAAYLFMQKVIYRVMISGDEIVQEVQTGFRLKKVHFKTGNIQKMEVRTMYGWGSGYYYYLFLKDGRRIRLLALNEPFLNPEKLPLINAELEKRIPVIIQGTRNE
jgi:hypothetical protein